MVRKLTSRQTERALGIFLSTIYQCGERLCQHEQQTTNLRGETLFCPKCGTFNFKPKEDSK